LTGDLDYQYSSSRIQTIIQNRWKISAHKRANWILKQIATINT